ncbi:MAG: hypothetical protein ACPHXR_02595 [Flavicella sp.]
MKHHKNTYRRFLDYLKDRLSNRERNAYERETLSDSFENEAMEGLDMLEIKQQLEDTENLFKNIQEKGKKLNKNYYYGYRIAASVLVIFGISALIFNSVDTDKQQEEFFNIPQNLIDIDGDLIPNDDANIDDNVDIDKDLDENLEKDTDKEIEVNYEVEVAKNSNENSSKKGDTKYKRKTEILDKIEINEQVIVEPNSYDSEDELEELVIEETSRDDIEDEFVESVQNKQHRETIVREKNDSKGKHPMQKIKNILPDKRETLQKKPSKIERNALEALSKEQDVENEKIIGPNVNNQKNKNVVIPEDRKAISPMGNLENFKNWLFNEVDTTSKSWLLLEESNVILTVSKNGLITDIQYINSKNKTINNALDTLFLKAGIWKPAIKKATFVQDTIHIKYMKK